MYDSEGAAIPDAAIDWSSNDPLIATVDADGLVTAVSNGTTQITATSGSVSASATIVVDQDAGGVTITPSSAMLMSIGETLQLEAVVYDSLGTAIPDAAIAWSSSDPSVATVDSDGLVTAVSNGTTQISATFDDISSTAEISVMQISSSITITPDSAMLTSVGEMVQLEAVVYDSEGAAIPDAAIAWSNNDPSIATVDADGRVTAVSNGMTQITATSGGVSASARIVVDQETGSIIITPASAMLASIEETLQLEAVVYDSLGAAILGAPVVWSSNDPSIATVDADGRVTAVSNGTTQITATSGGVSASARIVVDQEAGSIIITPASAMLASIEETLQLEAVVYDSEGAAILGAPIVWSSNDPSVAAVAADGLVTAVSNGMTQITATSGGVSASARIVVDQEAGSIIITPASAMLASIEETLQLEAVVYDSLGAAILGAPVVCLAMILRSPRWTQMVG